MVRGLSLLALAVVLAGCSDPEEPENPNQGCGPMHLVHMKEVEPAHGTLVLDADPANDPMLGYLVGFMHTHDRLGELPAEEADRWQAWGYEARRSADTTDVWLRAMEWMFLVDLLDEQAVRQGAPSIGQPDEYGSYLFVVDVDGRTFSMQFGVMVC